MLAKRSALNRMFAPHGPVHVQASMEIFLYFFATYIIGTGSEKVLAHETFLD